MESSSQCEMEWLCGRDKPQKFRFWFSWLTLVGLFATVSTVCSASNFIDKTHSSTSDSIADLDSRFQTALDQYLSSRELGPNKQSINWDSVLNPSKSPLNNLIEIRRHEKALLQKLDRPEIFEVLDYLYQYNDTAMVRKLTDRIKAKGGAEPIALHYLMLAKYYEGRGRWDGVRASLKNIKVAALPEQDQHYYYLLMGYALQQLKEHRKSYLYYRKVPSGSPYYIYAKLNEGTAYLKQGWWTEAHIEFNKAIGAVHEDTQAEILNRLYVTLGFSQLHYEFYRDARKTLHNVSLNSKYTNKALMGLGLSAAYQEDFVGAINAFKILADKKPQDLNVDEVKLLLPKSYEEIGDLASAMEEYQTSIDYYKRKSKQIGQMRREISRSKQDELLQLIDRLKITDEQLFSESNLVPEYFLNNFSLLNDISKAVPDLRKYRYIEDLQADYSREIKSVLRSNLQVRDDMIDSYLSQAKLGMAKLYDRD